MIAGLDPRVNIIFEPDGEHFLLSMPYGQAAKDFMGCYSMTGLAIQRQWMPEDRAWRFNASNYDDIMELLPDFFEAAPIPVGIQELF